MTIEVPARARKQPRQSRSLAMVGALREACLDILENQGRDALTVNAIADRAGVGISSIYEYYPTLEALVSEVFGEIRLELRNSALERLNALPDGARLIDGIETMLQVAVELLDRWSKVDAELFAKFTRYDELVRLDLILSEKTLAATIVDSLFLRFDSEITTREREKARFYLHQSLLALMRATALLRPDYLHEEATLNMLGRMLHSLLTETESATSAS
ncbi:helix-turn-helix domain-containing protein [Novosphingobium aquae]|uniref:Helix-turn-helix domain-containing protein n=1 Tax=Novosphingobium aquae TaxID=3133435 RepID=A0ABU8S610_9SPHN